MSAKEIACDSGKPYTANDCTAFVTRSMTSGATPLRSMPARSFTHTAFIFSCERWKLSARRSSSASLPVKSAMTIAIFKSCSWNSGTPSVRSSTGRRRSSKNVTGSRPCRRARYGCSMSPWIGPGRMMATSTTTS